MAWNNSPVLSKITIPVPEYYAAVTLETQPSEWPTGYYTNDTGTAASGNFSPGTYYVKSTSKTYFVKDSEARTRIEALEQSLTEGVLFVGKTNSKILETDSPAKTTITKKIGNDYTGTIKVGATADPTTTPPTYGPGALVTVDRTTYAPDTPEMDPEFIWDGTQWLELGCTTQFGDLAFTDIADIQTASNVVTASGAVSIDDNSTGSKGTVVTGVTFGEVVSGGTTVVTALPSSGNTCEIAIGDADVSGTIATTDVSITQGTATPVYIAPTQNVITASNNALTSNTTVVDETLVLSFITSTTPAFTSASTAQSAAGEIAPITSIGNPELSSAINFTATNEAAIGGTVTLGTPSSADLGVTVTNGYLHQAADTASKVGIEKKTS